MDDKGVVLRAALGLEDAAHRILVEASAPRPYTVSVGMPSRPPRRRIAAASATAFVSCSGWNILVSKEISSFRQFTYRPSSSPTSTTLMRPAGLQKRVMTIWEQMQSGLVQSPHWPLTAQGVLPSKRWALAGAAM